MPEAKCVSPGAAGVCCVRKIAVRPHYPRASPSATLAVMTTPLTPAERDLLASGTLAAGAVEPAQGPHPYPPERSGFHPRTAQLPGHWHPDHRFGRAEFAPADAESSAFSNFRPLNALQHRPQSASFSPASRQTRAAPGCCTTRPPASPGRSAPVVRFPGRRPATPSGS